jgi:chromatin segregation and condensation protein Rec8/ScpA/Scc1 (kleisin family)
LVLIKSKALLPNLSLSEEEEEGIYDLERRLKIYGQLKPMFAIVKKQWQEANPFYSRPLFFLQPAVFYPPSKISPQLIKQALEKLIGSIGSFFLENETIKRQLFTLEEKIAEVTLKITQGFSKFSQIISHKTKEEVIVMFLALLHLLRENIFTAKQEKLFDDIQIEKFNNTL